LWPCGPGIRHHARMPAGAMRPGPWLNHHGQGGVPSPVVVGFSFFFVNGDGPGRPPPPRPRRGGPKNLLVDSPRFALAVSDIRTFERLNGGGGCFVRPGHASKKKGFLPDFSAAEGHGRAAPGPAAPGCFRSDPPPRDNVACPRLPPGNRGDVKGPASRAKVKRSATDAVDPRPPPGQGIPGNGPFDKKELEGWPQKHPTWAQRPILRASGRKRKTAAPVRAWSSRTHGTGSQYRSEGTGPPLMAHKQGSFCFPFGSTHAKRSGGRVCISGLGRRACGVSQLGVGFRMVLRPGERNRQPQTQIRGGTRRFGWEST